MTLADYLKILNDRFKTGISTEHSYRGDLQQLIVSLAPGVMATNEPARVEFGATEKGTFASIIFIIFSSLNHDIV